MKKVTFYFGLVRVSGKPVLDRTVELFHKYLANNLGAYTAYTATGHWNGQTEPTLVVEWITSDEVNYREEAKDCAYYWRMYGEQNSVLITFETVDSLFVDGHEVDDDF